MRYQRKNDLKKLVLSFSDVHLGAGKVLNGKRNFLEDFHYDREMVDFLDYYSGSDFDNCEVELVINGDFVDLLAVPFVRFFDDEFWSEKASLEKLKLIVNAHKEIFKAMNLFTTKPKNRIVYIIGNHDAEMILPALKDYFMSLFSVDNQSRITIFTSFKGEYSPHPSIIFKHGHEYELPHHFDPEKSIVYNEKSERYFVPPWGSYYVIRIINKFKEEKNYINLVRPIRKFLINSFIYDTLFTIRFLLSNTFYFIMVRFLAIYKSGNKLKQAINLAVNELELFRDYETLVEDFFKLNETCKILVVGHTHDPIFRTYIDGTTFINTGTWTKMYSLDFDKQSKDDLLTYAHIEVSVDDEGKEIIFPSLNIWKGRSDYPFSEFS